MTDIVERLRTATVHGDQAEAITAMLLAADKIERLRAALEPFAKAAGHTADGGPDDAVILGFPGHDLTLGHLRRAAAALANGE